MSNKKMLIDATHPEETRVVVLDGKRLEDYDVEVATKRQIKGNIYLAKITRVEPSLQAAFVDYGGNRHGFLAFSEIHPDYYQIPVSDREALIAEQDAADKADEAKRSANEDAEAAKEEVDENGKAVAEIGGDDSEEVESRRPAPPHKRYKIQEVMKRRQIMLVQVVKEERGNKGAALTTYLSLAGRYCVLMPNTARGGGISRKIPAAKDRKRLKDILKGLNIPEGMAVIVRTAGAKRTKAEIKRDYEYLLRQWNKVREMTLDSTAPSEVYEEGDIIKRAIRDLYNSEIDEVVVDGEEGYRQAKDFMKLLIPSHAKKVQPYKDIDMPMLRRYQVETQLDAMHNHEVQLRSGGYIVINPTEALVSIDVNSGKSTRERNIEETALKTNLEAAEEVARQLRLRDLAGLVVIDFIDMERSRNQTQVERRLKDSMKNDRARIQIGRISAFGLMELSRQRLRPSLHETSFDPCPHCSGSGIRRSTDSTALHILRAIEEEGIKRKGGILTIHVPTEVALYILNNKRPSILDLEARYDFAVTMESDNSLVPPNMRVSRAAGETPVQEADSQSQSQNQNQSQSQNQSQGQGDTDDTNEDGTKRKRRRRRRGGRGRGEDNAVEATEETEAVAVEIEAVAETDDDAGDKTDATISEDDENGEGGEKKKRRRRGRRGGRRRRKASENGTGEDEASATEDSAEGSEEQPTADASDAEASAEAPDAADANADKKADADAVAVEGEGDANAEEKPKRRRRRRTKKVDAEAPAEDSVEAVAEGDAPAADVSADANAEATSPEETTGDKAEEEKPKRRRRRRAPKKADAETDATPSDAPVEEAPAKEAAVAEEATPEKPAAPEPAPEPAPVAAAAPIEVVVAPKPEPEVPEVDDEESAARKAEAAKTTVVDLSDTATEEKPTKRGWWSR